MKLGHLRTEAALALAPKHTTLHNHHTMPQKRRVQDAGRHLETPTRCRIRSIKEWVDFCGENNIKDPRIGASLRNLARLFSTSKSTVSYTTLGTR